VRAARRHFGVALSLTRDSGRVGPALKWSTRLIVLGVLICLIGVVPPYLSGPTIDALESAAGFISVGILILLLGVGLRKLQRAIG
jgi:hypothetical protein